MILAYGFLLKIDEFGKSYGETFSSLDDFFDYIIQLGYDTSQNDTHIFLYDASLCEDLTTTKILDNGLFDFEENESNLDDLREALPDSIEMTLVNFDPTSNSEEAELQNILNNLYEEADQLPLPNNDDDEEFLSDEE